MGDGLIFPKANVPLSFKKTFRMNLISAESFSLDIPLMLDINRSHVSGKTASPFDSTTTVPWSSGRERTTFQLLTFLFCLICHVARWRPATGENCHVAKWSTKAKFLLGKIIAKFQDGVHFNCHVTWRPTSSKDVWQVGTQRLYWATARCRSVAAAKLPRGKKMATTILLRTRWNIGSICFKKVSKEAL